jgi:ABC-type amino acid transport system permease subunit
LHSEATRNEPITISLLCLAIILALIAGVGLATGLVLRHLVQTAPLWIVVVLGATRSRATGWGGLPLFVFWFALMALIWLYLLGIAHILSGHFMPIEVAMTVIVGVASLSGILMFARFRSGLRAAKAGSLFIAMALLQWACFRLSFLPAIVRR